MTRPPSLGHRASRSAVPGSDQDRGCDSAREHLETRIVLAYSEGMVWREVEDRELVWRRAAEHNHATTSILIHGPLIAQRCCILHLRSSMFARVTMLRLPACLPCLYRSARD